MAIVEQPDDTPATEAEANLGVREFKSELAAATVTLDNGLSLERRPDAISLDYLTCFTMGPINVGDFSAGPVDRPWRIRCIGNNVFRSRLNDDRTDFEDDQLLFSFAGVSPTEIDAAFDQAARVLVCMERPSGQDGLPELWIYYYDPFAADYILTKFGVGRTPRAILDDAQDSSNADILVFYMNNDVGLCYRQQRDRYATEYIVTGTVPTAVDTSGLNIVDLVWNYSGPADSISGYLGYPSVQANNAILRSVGGTPALHDAPPSNWYVGIIDAANPLVNKLQGYAAYITFTVPVNFFEAELVSALQNGCAIIAYDVNGVELGRKTFVSSGAPQIGQLAYTGIKTVLLSSDQFKAGTWRNMKYSTDSLPVIAPDAWPPAPLIFLEDVYRSTDRRVNVLYSVHDPIAGTYKLQSKSTVLYPFNIDTESWQMLHTLPQASQVPKVVFYALPVGDLTPEGAIPEAYLDPDNWQMLSALPQNSLLVSIVITHTLYDIDNWQMLATLPQSGSLPVVIVSHTLYDIDNWQMLPTLPQSGTLPVIVIFHTLYDTDNWQMLATLPQSGILA